MDNIPRYGLKRGDLGKDGSLKSAPVASKNVAAKFLDTPGRRKMRKVIKVMGLVSFCLTIIFLVGALVSLFSERIMSEARGIFACCFIAMFFVNGVGMFIEIAGDNGGKNWFSKGFFVTLVSVLGGFLIGVFYSLVF